MPAKGDVYSTTLPYRLNTVNITGVVNTLGYDANGSVTRYSLKTLTTPDS